ncbi:PSP1 C-terminal conserved region-domain-containing protein [Chlamydoabsidia padenii]|nr:PSP1 C-terminal conserved region-domain-containing protein [Chlamydoabsidia padenii]
MYHENGKGVPLHRFPAHGPLYMVEFKAGRIDFYYLSMVGSEPMVGDLVIVEADRGKDLGKVANVGVTCKKAMDILQAVVPDELDPSLSSSSTYPVYVKRIHRLATPDEINMLLIKSQDEQRALVICQQKIKQRKLQMEVVDAEYQWDRRKMTFYFNAERRIDFRELVRDLFKVYKTRIWM